ncbi:hypothetical protein RRG08_007290 [Elysia crispata]|uniref:Uncharacterized protein n=1 Tax=Elysia crispata TaxID=231223 RepID=A0AAE0XYL8_9GAST|nr:hypothetical protein RRG08_007290 [Elysia crispata]
MSGNVKVFVSNFLARCAIMQSKNKYSEFQTRGISQERQRTVVTACILAGLHTESLPGAQRGGASRGRSASLESIWLVRVRSCMSLLLTSSCGELVRQCWEQARVQTRGTELLTEPSSPKSLKASRAKSYLS